MSGTIAGGKKAAMTNKAKYGEEFYVRIGRRGGLNGHTGGFASNPALARIAGAKGGRMSKRKEGYSSEWNKVRRLAFKMYGEGKSYASIARSVGMPYGVVRNRIKAEYYA